MLCVIHYPGLWLTALPPSIFFLPPYQGSLDVLLLACLAILLLASPGLKCWRLQGPAIREGQSPGAVQVTLVDGIQVDGGLFLTLATGQKGHTCGEENRVGWKSQGYYRDNYSQYISVCTSPGTDGGTVRRRAVTVAMAISWGLYFLGQECPAVTMLGLSRVPSR